MSDTKRRIDHILDAGYLHDLPARTTEQIRTMRTECQAEEGLLSYERRLVHGRIAILRTVAERRASGDSASIVKDLPKILADLPTRSRGAFPGHDPELEFEPARRVSRLVANDDLAALPVMTEEQIHSAISELEEAEAETSLTRRAVLDVVDALNREIARRYQSGEADPSDVLSGR